MRKVTQQICSMFIANTNGVVSNSYVADNTLYLHGNAIARHANDAVELSCGGRTSATTKERLNGVLELLNSRQRVTQRDFVWYFVNLDTGELTEFDTDNWNKVTV